MDGMGPEPEVTSGRWTAAEHDTFLAALQTCGRNWRQIADLIPSRTVVQIRTHAQKYFQKYNNAKNKNGNNNMGGDEESHAAERPHLQRSNSAGSAPPQDLLPVLSKRNFGRSGMENTASSAVFHDMNGTAIPAGGSQGGLGSSSPLMLDCDLVGPSPKARSRHSSFSSLDHFQANSYNSGAPILDSPRSHPHSYSSESNLLPPPPTGTNPTNQFAIGGGDLLLIRKDKTRAYSMPTNGNGNSRHGPLTSKSPRSPRASKGPGSNSNSPRRAEAKRRSSNTAKSNRNSLGVGLGSEIDDVALMRPPSTKSSKQSSRSSKSSAKMNGVNGAEGSAPAFPMFGFYDYQPGADSLSIEPMEYRDSFDENFNGLGDEMNNLEHDLDFGSGSASGKNVDNAVPTLSRLPSRKDEEEDRDLLFSLPLSPGHEPRFRSRPPLSTSNTNVHQTYVSAPTVSNNASSTYQAGVALENTSFGMFSMHEWNVAEEELVDVEPTSFVSQHPISSSSDVNTEIPADFSHANTTFSPPLEEEDFVTNLMELINIRGNFHSPSPEPLQQIA